MIIDKTGEHDLIKAYLKYLENDHDYAFHSNNKESSSFDIPNFIRATNIIERLEGKKVFNEIWKLAPFRKMVNLRIQDSIHYTLRMDGKYIGFLNNYGKKTSLLKNMPILLLELEELVLSVFH